MAAGSARAGKAYIELGVRSKLTAGLNAAARRIDAFGARVRRVGTLMAGIGVGATAGLVAASRSFASAGAEIRDLSIRLGIGAETLSRLNYAAAQAGANFQGVAKGIGRLARVTSDAGRGLETYQRTFRDLGIDIAQFQQLSLEDQFLTAGTALSKITDESKRAAIAQELFGRSGLELIPIFENGAASVRAFFDEADRLGVTISDEEAKSAKALDDAYTRVTTTLQRVTAAVGEALAPELTALANNIAENIANVRAWLKENSGLIVSAAKGAVALAGVGAAVVSLGAAVSAAAVAVKGMGVALAVVGVAKTAALSLAAALAAIGPVAIAAGAAAAAITTAWVAFGVNANGAIARVGTSLRNLKYDAMVGWEGVVAAINAGDLEKAAAIAMTGFEIVFKTAINRIADFFYGVMADFAQYLVVLRDTAKEVTSFGLASTNTDLSVALVQNIDIARQRSNEAEVDALRARLRKLRDESVDALEQRREDMQRAAEGEDSGRRRPRQKAWWHNSNDTGPEAPSLDPLTIDVEMPEVALRDVAVDGDALTDAIEDVLDAASAGLGQAENLRTMTRGTFSAFAAGRINSAMDQVQREQLSQLKAIARNTSTATGQVYTP